MFSRTAAAQTSTRAQYNGLIDLELGVPVDFGLHAADHPAHEQLIVTGIDRLLWLVNAFGKISTRDAARKLAVDEETIERRAMSLIEQGTASMRVGLFSHDIVKREMSAPERESHQKVLKARKRRWL
jgi:hypothetical protein